jgi:hypothetical protein
MAEVYEPVVDAIPERLRGRLDAAEIFHEILEHRWFLSEAAGRDVGDHGAAADYFATVLPAVPDDLVVPAGPLPPVPPSRSPEQPGDPA